MSELIKLSDKYQINVFYQFTKEQIFIQKIKLMEPQNTPKLFIVKTALFQSQRSLLNLNNDSLTLLQPQPTFNNYLDRNRLSSLNQLIKKQTKNQPLFQLISKKIPYYQPHILKAGDLFKLGRSYMIITQINDSNLQNIQKVNPYHILQSLQLTHKDKIGYAEMCKFCKSKTKNGQIPIKSPCLCDQGYHTSCFIEYAQKQYSLEERNFTSTKVIRYKKKLFHCFSCQSNFTDHPYLNQRPILNFKMSQIKTPFVGIYILDQKFRQISKARIFNVKDKVIFGKSRQQCIFLIRDVNVSRSQGYFKYNAQKKNWQLHQMDGCFGIYYRVGSDERIDRSGIYRLGKYSFNISQLKSSNSQQK